VRSYAPASVKYFCVYSYSIDSLLNPYFAELARATNSCAGFDVGMEFLFRSPHLTLECTRFGVHIQGFSYVICVKEALDWERIPKQLAKGKFTVFAMIAWGLWKNRNAMAIKLKFCRDPSNLPHTITFYMQKWQILQAMARHPIARCSAFCCTSTLVFTFPVREQVSYNMSLAGAQKT
jgi:hypothetical protein